MINVGDFIIFEKQGHMVVREVRFEHPRSYDLLEKGWNPNNPEKQFKKSIGKYRTFDNYKAAARVAEAMNTRMVLLLMRHQNEIKEHYEAYNVRKRP